MFSMKNSLLVLMGLMLSLTLSAQRYDPAKVNKKAATIYDLALTKAEDGKFTEAIQMLDQAIAIDKKYVDAYLSRAGIYGQIKNNNKAIENYEQAFLLDANYTHDYKLPYSINLAGKGEFEKALIAVDDFVLDPRLGEPSRKAAAYRRKTYQFAIDYAKTHTIKDYIFAPQNLGDSINSKVSEYFPSLTIDGKQLVFTRRVNNMNEDFYESKLLDNNNWTLSKPLPGDINTERNEGAQNISVDGKVLVFTSCDAPEGFGGCDLYYALLTKKGWSQPFNMGKVINSDAWESQPSIAPDKRALYFAAREEGGFGGSDIYVSYIMPDGKWGVPMNMGPDINTSADETSPFIHADNQTLYFTSDGLPGYGGADLFLVRKDSSGHWGKPVNLGYPINTIDHEGTLFIAANGRTAYYASDRYDTRGGLDLYTFNLREDVRPIKALWVKGKVYDKLTKLGLPSSVELKDIKTGQRSSKVQTDEEGNYLITLPVGKDYAFSVNRKGYLIYSESFPLSTKPSDSTYQIDIPLQPIVANANVILKNIFFETKKFDLRPESIAELDNLFELLNENPTIIIQINGYTDNVGKPADNLLLSNNRSKSVVNYLASKGIGKKRLLYKGFGETRPIADNKTEEGRAKNRRTELQVISK
jgi:outer membrane protein OmpA-like peptidoglycan-associated protein/tetratricopeptide (TPR) repeat protein